MARKYVFLPKSKKTGAGSPNDLYIRQIQKMKSAIGNPRRQKEATEIFLETKIRMLDWEQKAIARGLSAGPFAGTVVIRTVDKIIERIQNEAAGTMDDEGSQDVQRNDDPEA